jgi:hypothetical protein
VFIKQVFYGCIRYEEFLRIFCKVFYQVNSFSLIRSDTVMYSIFAYLTFFRLDELQLVDYKRLLLSQESFKMHIFLNFTFDVDLLKSQLREKWSSAYDY